MYVDIDDMSMCDQRKALSESEFESKKANFFTEMYEITIICTHKHTIYTCTYIHPYKYTYIPVPPNEVKGIRFTQIYDSSNRDALEQCYSFASGVYMYVCVYVCMHVCMYVCVYDSSNRDALEQCYSFASGVYVCMYVCMYVERERE
jgi:hypothetical protein